MSVYIISVLSKEKISINEERKIQEKIGGFYNHPIETASYKYEDRNFYELDFDIRDIVFHEDLIHKEIDKIISVFEIIFELVSVDCEIIGGYNDTENAILLYEKDRELHYKKFGLFATRHPFEDGKPYFDSNGLTVYQSFEYDSMGVIF